MDKIREVIRLESKINENFRNAVLEKQGFERHLGQMYKPIVEAQKATTSAIVESSKQMAERQAVSEDLLTKMHETPLMSEIIDIVMRYPDVMSTIINPDEDHINNLNQHELAIYNKAKKLPRTKFDLLRDYILSEVSKQAEEAHQAEEASEPQFGAEEIGEHQARADEIGDPPEAESTPKETRSPKKKENYILDENEDIIRKSDHPELEGSMKLGESKEDKFNETVIIDNLVWGSQKYTNALAAASSRSIDKSNRFGLLYRSTPERNTLYIGTSFISSDVNDEITNEGFSVKGTNVNNVWELLSKEQLQAPSATNRFRYTDKEIIDYLVLLNAGGIRIDPKLQKSRILGEYISEYGIDDMEGPINSDAKYYASIAEGKHTGTGIYMNKNELHHDLARLVSSYKAGNKGLHNQINNIVDTLRRNGAIDIEDSKKIYKAMK